ncbi:putative fumarylacetoacetate hydrolase [Nostocoides australiense Ben110]|uniref:Putative fumarylacetoacetate hydrolase n=1 Tax=Nostocoides australiense Ben110 TaxID=1193182 RepID=W6K2N6_9MICO|nr:fumarylacetoacetate hydrolase family protein [Tetrasphaera australiensis]CCH75365.1 putative fumarylacetoacetate hydrolase [Tetrasphaera australiensis Ben110]
MRMANVGGRAAISTGGAWIDLEAASEGRFSADPQAAYGQVADIRDWVGDALPADAPEATGELGVPVPMPRQLIAIGLNYREHAIESNLAIPEHPVVFTKFQSSLVGPGATVTLPSDGVDWEVELVVVIGKEGHQIPAAQAWDHVAGLTVGQDLSWREVQGRGPAPQFAMGKSYPGFSPLGPYVVTVDEFADKDDLAISCALDGEVLQEGRTSDLIFPVADLIARLSEALTLYPGDLIYTGTPKGVGMGREPKRFLVPGELVSSIEGIGDLSITLVGKAD